MGLTKKRKSSRGFVELESGITVALSDCLKQVPLMTFLTRTHIDVCDVLSKRIPLGEEQRQVFVNLLRIHSEAAREITAAVSLINSGKFIAQRFVSIADRDALAPLLPIDMEIDTVRGSAALPLLDISQLFRFLIKACAHRFYRLWPSSTNETDVAVRAWVELSETIYPKVHRDGTILIYPFYLNIPRHIRYVRHCRKEYSNVQLAGLPYSIVGFVWDLIWRRDRDVALVSAEVCAFRKHANEISHYARKALFCNDEFEAGVICLTSKLKRDGVRVANTSHGLSFGSPYVGYDEFTVFNAAQADYYSYRSPNTEFRVEIRRNAAIGEGLSKSSEFHPVVLLMHGNFTRADLQYERRLERAIIGQLRKACSSIGIGFKVKLHPNAIREDIDIFKKIENVETIYRLDELGKANPLFVATITTALYDFYRDGPFLFVNDGIVPIEDIYGYPFPSFNLQGLNAAVSANLVYDSYHAALNAQISALEGN